MDNETIVTGIVLTPVVGSLVLPVIGRLSTRFRDLLALVLVGASLAGSLALVPSAMAGQTTTVRLGLPLGLDFVLYADGLAVFTAIVGSVAEDFSCASDFTMVRRTSERITTRRFIDSLLHEMQ